MLPLQARVDLEAMLMKGCFTFPKAPALLEPHHQTSDWLLSYQDTRWRGVLPLCREAVGVFYSLSQLGQRILVGGRGVLPLCRGAVGVFCMLLLRAFGLLILSLLLYWQRFSQHVFQPSSSVGAVDKAFGWKVLPSEIIWRLQFQS